MSSATKIRKGEYAYRGYEIAKKAAMIYIDEMIEQNISQSRMNMTAAELIAIDGVGWAWLEQKNHIHEEVKT